MTFWLGLVPNAHDVVLLLKSKEVHLLGSATVKVLGAIATAVSGIDNLLGYIDQLDQLIENALGGLGKMRAAESKYRSALIELSGVIGQIERLLTVPCDEDPDPDPKPTRPLTGSIAVSVDPNEIVGPAGVGVQQWVSAPFEPSYSIHYENLGAGSLVIPPGLSPAQAPAARVVITTVLDADLDLATFELGSFGFGATNTLGYPAMTFDPPPGAQSWSEETLRNVPVYGTAEPPVGVVLRGSATLDPATRTVTWVIEVLDPETGLVPDDPLVGFLPPEPLPAAGRGAGQGFADFSIATVDGVAAGAQVDAPRRSCSTPTIRSTPASGATPSIPSRPVPRSPVSAPHRRSPSRSRGRPPTRARAPVRSTCGCRSTAARCSSWRRASPRPRARSRAWWGTPTASPCAPPIWSATPVRRRPLPR